VLIGVPPRIVSTFFSSPPSCAALPKKKAVLSNSLAHSRNLLSPLRRNKRAMTSFIPPYSPAM
jgi:hypothetical protein